MGTNLNCKVYIVAASAPQNGVAIVFDATKASPTVSDAKVAFMPCSDGDFGAHTAYIPSPNSRVLCADDPNDTSRTYIIGPANWINRDRSEGGQGKRWYNTDRYTFNDNKTNYTIITELLKQIISGDLAYADRGTGTDIDQVPGDFIIQDKNEATGIYVGRLVSALRGSPIAYIEAAATSNTVTAVGDTLTALTFGTEHVAQADIQIDNTAVSPAEVFGEKIGTVCVKTDESVLIDNGEDDPLTGQPQGELKTATDATLPLYRMQRLEGAPVGGRESIVVGFPYENGEECEAHNTDTEPPVLSRRRDSLTGELTDASTNSIMSVKSPYIPSVLQRGYGKDVLEQYKEKDAEHPDLRTPYEYKAADSEEEKIVGEDEATIDAAINKVLDKLLSTDYVDKLLSLMADRGLSVHSKDKSVCAIIDEEATVQYKGGYTDKQMYDLPKSERITNPVTGKSSTYYSAMSFISQEPNGDILLADGYGSEIRMSRGNIYISPALDLILRPGRDLSVMAGRYQSYNSQDSCTINTSDGMYIKSDKEMKIAGAMNKGDSKNASLTIECGNDDSSSGMIIRSKANIGIGASSISISGSKLNDSEKNTPEYPDSCSIVVDAGTNGSVYLAGKYISNVADDITLAAALSTSDGSSTASSGNPAALRLNANGCVLAAKSIEQDALSITMGARESDIKVYSSPEPGKSTETIIPRSTASTGTMYIKSRMYIADTAKFNGSIIACKNSWILNLATESGSVSTAPPRPTDDELLDGKDTKDMSKEEKEKLIANLRQQYTKYPFEPYTFQVADEITVGIGASNGAHGNIGRSSSYLSMHRFWFPVYDVGYVIRMPGMRWQTWYELDDNEKDGSYDNPAKWAETAVKSFKGDDTYVYPGASCWDSKKGGKLTCLNYETKKISSDYVINVKSKGGK